MLILIRLTIIIIITASASERLLGGAIAGHQLLVVRVLLLGRVLQIKYNRL